jgi:hypothetical protein
MSGSLRYGPEGPPLRKAKVVLTSAEASFIADRSPNIEWTGLETAREAEEKRKSHESLTKKKKYASESGPHTVQGGLPELGRRR